MARLDRGVRRVLVHRHVDSGGDRGGRRNRSGAGPDGDDETLSCGVGSDLEVRSEGRMPCPSHGERARP